MGWIYDRPDLAGCYDHEGGVVALTYRTQDRTSGIFEELNYPDNATYECEAIARIQASCRCGWRSRYLVPGWGVYRDGNNLFRLPRWTPYSPGVTEYDEERCKSLWDEHVHQAVPGLAPVRRSSVTG